MLDVGGAVWRLGEELVSTGNQKGKSNVTSFSSFSESDCQLLRGWRGLYTYGDAADGGLS